MHVTSSPLLFAPGIAFGVLTLALIAIPCALQSPDDGRPDPKSAKWLLRLAAVLTGLFAVALLAFATMAAYIGNGS